MVELRKMPYFIFKNDSTEEIELRKWLAKLYGIDDHIFKSGDLRPLHVAITYA